MMPNLQETASPASRLVPVAATAAAALATILALRWLAAGRHAEAGATAEEKKELLKMLEDLSRRFFFVCKDFAMLARQVRTKLEAAERVKISETALKDELAKQYKLWDKLEEIQAAVAKQHGVSLQRMQELQQSYGNDSCVKEATDGFRAMLDDSFKGDLPILPRTNVPARLTKEKILEIQEEAQNLGAEKMAQRFSDMKAAGSPLGLQELGEALIENDKKAWEDTLEKQSDLLEGGPEVYYSALAVYTRDSAFAAEHKQLDESRQQKLADIYKSFKMRLKK